MASAFWRRVTVVVDIASQALARSGVGAEFRCLGFSCGDGDDGDGGDGGDGGGRVTTAATVAVTVVAVTTVTVATVMTATGAAKNRTPLW